MDTLPQALNDKALLGGLRIALLLLMALLVPLVPYVWVQVNPFIALLFLAGVMSILRWPLIFLGRWLNRQFTRITDRFQ